MEILVRIYAVALPILASSLVALIAIFVNIGFLGQDNSFYLYVMGIYLPISFVVMAINESLRVSSIAFSSQASGNNDLAGLRQRLITLMGLSVLVFLVVYLLFTLIQQPFMNLFDVRPEDQAFIGRFIQDNLLAGIVVIISMLMMSSLYGLGYTNSVTILTIISFAANVALTYYFVFHLRLGIYSIVYSSLITAGATSLVAATWLNRIGVLTGWRVPLASVAEGLYRIRNISAPVLAGYGIMFAHILIFNKLLVQFGPDDIAGFSVSHRLQNIALMPAIATGIAIAIHVNRLRSNQQAGLSPRFIRTGVLSSFVVYLGISWIIFAFREPFIGMITDDAAVVEAASKYLYYIGPSYLVLGPLLVMLIFFEQTGKGIRSLTFNAISFGVQLSAAFYVAYRYDSIDLVYKVVAAGYMITVIYILYELRRSARFYASNQTQTI